MAFQAEHYPGEIHLYAATLENPQDFEPSFHVHYRKSYHGFIWTIHSIAILGVLLLIRTNASSCQSPSVLGFQFNHNEKHAYGTWPPGSRF